MSVNPIPEGARSVTPYLMVPPGTGVLDFMVAAFGAKVLCKMVGPDGSIMHAEVEIGDSRIMMSEVSGEWKPMPACVHLYLADVDSVYKTALAAGAISQREPADQFYGDRSAGVLDAAGNQWYIATHIEDVSEEEMLLRVQKLHQAA